MITHTGSRSNTIPHVLASIQAGVTDLCVQTYLWSQTVDAYLRRAVVSIDEIDGQKQGSAPCAVNNHTKRNSTGRKFINTNGTLLRLRTNIGYLPDRTEGMEDRGASSKSSRSQSRHEGSILLAVR